MPTGIEEGLWLSAASQIAGRGRQGRAWQSEPGNVAASTVVRLRPADPAAPTLAFVAAVALEEAAVLLCARDGVGAIGADMLALKWPNDLLLGGAKLAGILLERAGDAVVIGFGVNLAHHPDLPERPTTSMAEHGHAIAPDIFVEVLAESFARWLARWRGEGFAPVRRRWLDRAHAKGSALSVHLPDGSRVEGLFDGIDQDGALVLRLADGGRHVMHAGDVFLI